MSLVTTMIIISLICLLIHPNVCMNVQFTEFDDIPALLDPDDDIEIQTTTLPTINPTTFPTNVPSAHPTKLPTKFPTRRPTRIPTIKPTKYPTLTPTNAPTNAPTIPWDSSPLKPGKSNKGKKSKKTQSSISDEQLLKNAMKSRENYIQSNTAIKLYHLDRTVADDAINAFQIE